MSAGHAYADARAGMATSAQNELTAGRQGGQPGKFGDAQHTQLLVTIKERIQTELLAQYVKKLKILIRQIQPSFDKTNVLNMNVDVVDIFSSFTLAGARSELARPAASVGLGGQTN